MENSSAYQYFVKIGEDRGVDKGALNENRRSVAELAKDRFGEPNEEQLNAVEQISDLQRLRRMVRQVLHTSSWDELLRVL